MLIAGTLLAALVASQPVAAQSARAASVVPDGLFARLVHLDRKLAKLIHEIRTNGVGGAGAFGGDVRRIENAKLRMVDRFFGELVYGVKFSEVYNQLDCLDVNLAHAAGFISGKGNTHGSDEDRVVLALIEAGKKCKQKLEDELQKANQQPPCAGHAMLGNIYGARPTSSSPTSPAPSPPPGSRSPSQPATRSPAGRPRMRPAAAGPRAT